MSDKISASREVEAKFRVHSPYVIPDLIGDTTGIAEVDPPDEQELRAVNWDTGDLRLAREGVTLRHRSGEGEGKDGWHLKLPVREAGLPDASTGSRDELHVAGESATVPEEIRDLVTVWVRGSVLGPVATLVTRRTVHLLRDGGGVALAELTDDTVSVLNSGHVAGRFREIEVEDRTGGPGVIASVGDVLRSAGAVGGEFVPKVIRALGPQASAAPDPPLPGDRLPDDTAGVVIRDVLRRYVRLLMSQDIVVRRGQDDGVHQMRVAARRLRSALKTFRPLFHREWADSLRAELKWLADSLGLARDSEVLLSRLTDELDELPPELVLGPVRARVEQVVGGDLGKGGKQAEELLRSERYLALIDRLVDAAWEPLLDASAEQPAATELPPLVRKAWRTFARDADRLRDGDSPDEDWHQVRIDAKAARYACEAMVPSFGPPAKRLAKHAEAVQETLGEHQDAVIASDVLRTMATAPRGGTIAFTVGLLYARQQRAAAQARVRFGQVWTEAARPRHRRWLAT